MHESHKTRMSDSSLYDEVCVNCGVTDTMKQGNEPCPCPEKKSEERNNGVMATEVGIVTGTSTERIIEFWNGCDCGLGYYECGHGEGCPAAGNYAPIPEWTGYRWYSLGAE